MQHLLHVQREQEELREDGDADQQPADVRSRQRAQPEHPQRQQRRAERSSIATNPTMSAADTASSADRLGRPPAVLDRARHRVDEQHQAGGDRRGAGQVEVAVRQVGAALTSRRGASANTTPPTGTLMKKTHDQLSSLVRRRRAGRRRRPRCRRPRPRCRARGCARGPRRRSSSGSRARPARAAPRRGPAARGRR